ASPGHADSVGRTGKIPISIGHASAAAAAAPLVLQNDGTVAAAVDTTINHAAFALVRYNADGSLDDAFGTGGKVITLVQNGQSRASAIVLQPNGKLVAAGGFTMFTSGHPGFTSGVFFLTRYKADGSLDGRFGTGGEVMALFGGSASAVVRQPNGKLVAAGTAVLNAETSDFALVRYNAD